MRAVDFYRDAFAAVEVAERFTGPAGQLIHTELRIGDSVVMLTEESDNGTTAKSPESLGAVTAIMATYWTDVDAAWRRAVAAGAEVIFALEDQFYGERAGRLRDPFGQQWMLSQRIEVLTAEVRSWFARGSGLSRASAYSGPNRGHAGCRITGARCRLGTQHREGSRKIMNSVRAAFAEQGLVRVRDGRVLGGVVAGLGRRFGFEPWPARLVFALVLMLIPGSQLLVYPLLWIMMPDENDVPVAERSAATGQSPG